MLDTDFWFVFKVKCCIVRKCLQCLMASIACASYSMAVRLNSLPCSEREEKTTGWLFLLRVAANATSDASVLASEGMFSSMAVKKDSSTVF